MTARKQIKQKLLIAIVLIVLLALLTALALSGGNLALIKSLFAKDLSTEELTDQLMGLGWRGYLAITVLSTLQVVCIFLPAEPVQVLSGFTFGFPVGLLLCMTGVFWGSTLIYVLQSFFGDRMRTFFVKNLKLDLEKIARSSKGILILFILYLLPAIPYGMICFLAASMGLRYRRYLPVMLLGAMPSVCIGVGLGYMTIVSDWVVTVCVFSVLILLLIVLFFKKDTLFSKLNDYADKHKKTPLTRVKDANGFLLTVVYGLLRAYLFLGGVKVKIADNVKKAEKPSIVLCNHGSAIDFIFAAALLRKYKPNLIGARLYFYHDLLGKLLRNLGAFPKSMFAADMENARNCFTVLKKNGMLVMMPEARLSTVGRFEDIQENTYSFIHKAGVNVYTIKINGAYLANPKWGSGLRRGSVVEIEMDPLCTAEQIGQLTLDELKQLVDKRLFFNEFEWLSRRPDIRYKSKRLAEGLENILMCCPLCGKKHTIKAKKNQLFCEHCGRLTALDKRYAFDDGFRFKNLIEWYDWQKSLLAAEIAENPDYALISRVELRLPGSGNSFTRHGGHGTCTLTREGLTYTGTKDGETVTLQFSIQRIYRLLFGAGVNFEIYDGPEILFFVPEEKRSAVDWYIVSMLLHNEAVRLAA